jgi:hypothetical protein
MVEPVIEDVPTMGANIEEADNVDTKIVLVVIELMDAVDAFNELTASILLIIVDAVTDDVMIELANMVDA